MPGQSLLSVWLCVIKCAQGLCQLLFTLLVLTLKFHSLQHSSSCYSFLHQHLQVCGTVLRKAGIQGGRELHVPVKGESSPSPTGFWE